VRAANHGFTVTHTYRFAPEGQGTRVSLDGDITAGGAKKLMIPMVAKMLREQDGDHLRRLKSVIEAS